MAGLGGEYDGLPFGYYVACKGRGTSADFVGAKVAWQKPGRRIVIFQLGAVSCSSLNFYKRCFYPYLHSIKMVFSFSHCQISLPSIQN